MALLHDTEFRTRVEARVRALTPDSRPRWGKMSVDQMLWHVNHALEATMGDVAVPPTKAPLPRAVMKFLILNVPWPKGAPTLPGMEATRQYDFEEERNRCYRLLETFAARGLNAAWPLHPMLGVLSGRDLSRLQAKHFEHHLKQFGV